MTTIELALKFTGNNRLEVSFDGTDSGVLDFRNPVIAKDRTDLRWYLEIYGATSLADPDDAEAKRIAERLPVIGKALFNAVFADRSAQRLFDRFQDMADQARVLTIQAEDAAILALPWELLHDPNGVYLFRERPHISIRRKISGATGGRPTWRVATKERLHLLFVVSRPSDAGFIDPRADAQAVLDAIEQTATGRVSYEFLRPATLNALVERLNDARKPAIDILHFDGHGIFQMVSEKELAASPALYGKTLESELQRERQSRKESAAGQPVGIGFLVFEKADGTKQLVSAAELSDNLFRAQVGLVVLSACQSAMLDANAGQNKASDTPNASGSDPMASVAGRLTRTGIPAILAMTHSVLVVTTQRLFAKFYGSLVAGRGIASALDDASIDLINNPEKYEVRRGDTRHKLTLYDWFLPTLYHGGSDTPLLLPQSSIKAGWQAAGEGATNLRPRHEVGFFGRRRELWEIERWFASGETRRISITGFGGQGKTELALEAGRWLLRTRLFAATVFISFVDYAQVQSADALGIAVSTIASVLNRTLIDANAVTQALRQTPTLLILDNLESIERSDPTALHELLSAAVAWSTAGESRLLLTSRSPDFNHADYRVAGTRKHRQIALRGLGSAANPDDALHWFGELSKLPSAQPAQMPPLNLQDSAKRQELIDLFDRVQFHPLSIAVLAQQLKSRSIRALQQRLVELLATPLPPGSLAEGTPHSLHASLQLSLDRLSERQRQAVRQLGVFQGGAFEDDLLAITQLDQDEWRALRRQLEMAALVEAEALPDVNPLFLRFHPTLAPLLWAQLAEAQQQQLSMAHRQRYAVLATYLYNEDRRNPIPTRAIARRELPNLLHTVRQALSAGDDNAAEFVSSVNYFLTFFGMSRTATTLTSQAETLGQSKGSPAWVLVQSNRGEQLRAAGQVAAAAQIFSEIRQSLGDTASYRLAVTLDCLGRCYHDGGRLDLAEDIYCQAITITQQLEKNDSVKRLHGGIYTDLADVLRDQGKFAEAHVHYEQGLNIKEELNDQRGVAVTLMQLGTLALREGNLSEAVQRYAEALQLFQHLDEPAMQAVAHHQRGRVFQQAKQWEQAEQHYRESAMLNEKLGNLSAAAQTWNQLAVLSEVTGKLAAAEQWYRKVIECFRMIGDSVSPSKCLNNLADLLQSQPGRLDEARQLAEEALAIKQTLDAGAAQIWTTYNILAKIAEQAGQAVQAADYRKLARTAKRNFAGTAHEMKRYAPVIMAVVGAVGGNRESKSTTNQFIQQSKQTGGQAALGAQSIERILAGERDADMLCAGLELNNAMIIETILQALVDPAVLAGLG